MNRGRGTFALTGIFLALVAAVLPTRASEPITVEVEKIEAGPGSIAAVALRLRAPDGAPAVQQIREVICFPPNLVKFDNLYRGPAAEDAEAEVTHQIEPADDCTRLVIRMTFRRPPQSGMLANLEFVVDQDAAVGEHAELTSEPELTGERGRLEAVGVSGAIQIVKPLSVFACFFYMH